MYPQHMFSCDTLIRKIFVWILLWSSDAGPEDIIQTEP